MPAQVFPIPLEDTLGSLIIPLVVGASGAVGLRRCFATSRPTWLEAGESRPFAIGGERRPLEAAGGERRPRETAVVDAADGGGENRVCSRVERGGEALCESITVGELRAGARLRNVSESRRRCP